MQPTLADVITWLENAPDGTMLSARAMLERLRASAPVERATVVATDDRTAEQWLTAEEAGKILAVSPRWCYDHAEQLGARRLSRRCVRFSSRAVTRHLGRRS